MTTLEMVERLRERADVTFEEAKAALDEANGDLLDAIILLERQGKTNAPPKGGAYSDKAEEPEEEPCADEKSKWKSMSGPEAFREIFIGIGTAIGDMLHKGNTNYIEAIKKGKVVLSCPVTIFILLLVLGFWALIPIMILAMFFGWKYRFRGDELGRDDLNDVLEKVENSAEQVVEEIKSKVAEKK